MTSSTKMMLAAILAVGTLAAAATDVKACGGRSRSSSYRSSYSPAPSYCARPSYTYPQPRPVFHPQPQPQFQQPQFQQPQRQTQFQPQPQAQPQRQTQFQPQPQFTQPAQRPAAPSAPGVATAPRTQPAQPVNPAPSAAPAQPAAPQTAAPQPATGNQPTGTAPASDPAMTALQALAGFSSAQPQTAPAATTQPQAPNHVGSWTSQLPNGARVQLSLQADGTFRWTATNQAGKSSAFQGSYQLGGNSLTLIRANDSRKLAGSMTHNGSNAFSFKLAGTNDAGLSFVRS